MEYKTLIGKQKEYINNNFEIESNILSSIVNQLSDTFDYNKFNIISKCDEYTTLEYGNFDLLRIKFTDKSKWIKLFLTKEDREKYEESELFKSQKNKNEFYWKSDIESEEDLNKYIPLLKNICIHQNKMQNI